MYFICRWRIVIHGGIDGYSRLLIFLQCSLAATILECFTFAVSSYGLPLSVRCDMGEENVGVAEFMWSQPDRGPSSDIMGHWPVVAWCFSWLLILLLPIVHTHGRHQNIRPLQCGSFVCFTPCVPSSVAVKLRPLLHSIYPSSPQFLSQLLSCPAILYWS